MAKRKSNRLIWPIVIGLCLLVVEVYGWHQYADNKKPKTTLQPPPGYSVDKNPPKIINEKSNQQSTTVTLNGYIQWSSCGSGCDGFAFVDSSGKYWTIATPSQTYSDYASRRQLIKIRATKINDTTIDNIKIE